MQIHSLYPLIFKPIYIEKVWGGNRLYSVLGKDCNPARPIGESWEVSAIEDFVSVVDNGFLNGNNLQEVEEIYMADLVGDRVYLKYGVEFPLLVKYIDANDVLSVQVHPDDETAKFRHHAYGKAEMWYVIYAEPDAELIMGWKHDMDRETLLKSLDNGTIAEHLNFVKVEAGDVFFIPPGRVHALGKGIVVAEIQQTSDITYRLYDWDRVGLDGSPRELHVDLALDVIDYKAYEKYKLDYAIELNKTVPLLRCDYFTTNLIEFDTVVNKNYMSLDSFVIYMVVEGSFALEYYKRDRIDVFKGQTVLLPAEFDQVRLIPYEKSKVLEVYVENIELNIQNTLDSFFGEGRVV